MFALRFGLQDDRFVDANTGLPLDEGLCRAARKTEIYYFISTAVATVVTAAATAAAKGEESEGRGERRDPKGFRLKVRVLSMFLYSGM